MKHTKKLVSLVLALVMALALATTASAATTTITNQSGHTYDAYQIFMGDVAEVSGSPVLSNVQWGTGINSATFLTALRASTDFGTPNPFTNCTTADDVAAAMKGEDEAFGQKFANLATKYLTTTKTTINASASSTTTLDSGYYLLMDVTNDAVRTSALVKAVGSELTITNKTTTDKSPVINKTVTGETAALVGVSTDTEIPFTVTATLPSNVCDYNYYKLVFKDTGTNLTFDTSDLTVKVMNGSTVVDTLTTSEYTASVANNVLTVTINDLLTAAPNAAAGHKVTLTYKATITDPTQDASNGVVVTHSSDPHSTDPQGPTQDTPTGSDSKVDVTSFSLKVINQTSGGNKLSGAQFVLTKLDGSTTKYAKLDTNNAIESWVDEANDATKLTTGTNGEVTFYGLDDQIAYTLKEVKAADGYNKAADVMFTINTPANDTDSASTDNSSVTGTAYNALQVTIENNAGATLPETGGVGTTLFYIIGGVLVVGAVVVLITRKRVGEDR